ncbi:unnamed protein product [Durusdinium trenchii]|uniref:Uncharacterized protein n=1 Tax=Durusdinium trenchii TaxID=1381693 RepID=A0ABP0I3V7_9DINO
MRRAGDMAMAMATALKGAGSVTKDELAKAKAMLKGKMLRQADNDSELMQDMGQQLLLTGKLIGISWSLSSRPKLEVSATTRPAMVLTQFG